MTTVPVLLFSSAVRACDPLPPVIGARDAQNNYINEYQVTDNVSIANVPTTLIKGMIEYLEPDEASGDDEGYARGDETEVPDILTGLRLALAGDMLCPVCEGDGEGAADNDHVCNNCYGMGIISIDDISVQT